MVTADWKPNRWLAAFATLFFWPLGMLYIGRWQVPLLYFSAVIAAALIEFVAGTAMYSFVVLLFASPVVAFWLAGRSLPKVRPWYSRWWGIIVVFLGLLAVIGPIRAFWIEPFRLPSTAMEPTIPQRSFILVSKVGYRHYGTYGLKFHVGPPAVEPARGALVVFVSPLDPDKTFIKRLIGRPGDTITFKDKAASVNGTPLTVSSADGLVTERLDGTEYQTVIRAERPASDFEFVVPANHYFLVGDNRDASDDSRRFGAVPAELLIGEVVSVLRRGETDADTQQ